MASWAVVLVALLVSWHYTDLHSSSVFYSAVCPVLVALFLIILVIKFVFVLGPESGRRGGNGDGGGFFGDFGGGDGDSGGSGDG